MVRLGGEVRDSSRWKARGRGALPSKPAPSSASVATSSALAERPRVDVSKKNHPAVPVESQPAASSYWNKALTQLKKQHPRLHEQLKQYGTTTLLPDIMTASEKWKVQESIEKDRGTRRSLRQGMKAVMNLKEIVLPVSRLDPSGVATIPRAGGICALLASKILGAPQKLRYRRQ
jgi:transketolase